MAAAIAQLLADSREAHAAYRAHSPHLAAVGSQLVMITGDAVLARQALDRAATLRKEAHDADPTLSDPAWDLDRDINDHLMTFYAELLAR